MIRIILFVCMLFFVSDLWAKSFCDNYTPQSKYVDAQNSIEKKIRSFSNTKIIATQADALLSKLIAAKSPVIVSWMNKRDLKDKPEDEIVKEWRFYFAKNFVLTKYPSGDKKVDSSVEQLVDGILKENLKSAFVKRLEKLFQKAKNDSIETVKAMKVAQKDDVLSRISTIKLYWPKNLKTSRNNAIPLDLIDWGIAYDPEANQINIGVNALSYPNDETYLAVFAHEIGHSFDSCRWGGYFKGPWPFEKVGSCLRSETSVGAKRRDDSSLESLAKIGKISNELVLALKQSPTCNKLAYPPPGIQADQLAESFADWFSAEVMAKSGAIATDKLRLDLCETKELHEGSSYPKNLERLNRIYFSHPKLKTNLPEGEKSAVYCPLD